MVKSSFRLKDGEIPSIGLGTWQLEGKKGLDAIVHAIRGGYKMIDCAFSYWNQELVGRAIKESGVPRSELFIVDKLANTWHTAAEDCLDETLKNLDVDSLDLWLMHWPSSLNHNGNDRKCPRLADDSVDYEKDWDYLKTWETMVEIQRRRPHEVKRIGVANFGIKELERIIQTGVVPEVNQVELHPECNQKLLNEYCDKKGILLVGYSPLGSIGSPLLKNSKLEAIAAKNNASVAQCLLSWGIQSGWPVIPRSSSPERIDQNITLIQLSEDDFRRITEIGAESPKRYINAPWYTFDDH
ncbi:hypothetical protein OGAPHI_005398 [Ogataea philodendri]|uniref:NADP-dependent oxidoreductase domain-containing protein n=1 Tax=Ogataea philodendri TaxID=1378263 RepID=A0A9P8T222_9ASCO|nr:uncharacterized protein OGAPHI_005398 [Ogataea philodendri]KAH3663408.1 hypothetical protein OGAPHI_005398 [Ogataea philodendri]